VATLHPSELSARTDVGLVAREDEEPAEPPPAKSVHHETERLRFLKPDGLDGALAFARRTP
jgi:hypothetical protein